MKNPFFVVVGLLLSITTATAKPQFGETNLFNSDWKFILNDIKESSERTYNDSIWDKINLPHDWTIKGDYSPDKASCTGYLPGGIGWYRKAFEVPANLKDKKLFIYFEGVYNKSEVYINGQLLGKRPNGYISFMYDLTPYIHFGDTNLIAVRVDHSEERDSRWYTGSGIYRDTYLVIANQVHIDLWGVFFKADEITDKKAVVSVETTLKNEITAAAEIEITHEIIDPATGETVATATKNETVAANNKQISTQQLTLNDPKRWSIEKPFLYNLKTTVKQNGKVIDANEQKLGLRTLTFDPDKGFALNDVWTKVKGVCIHHDGGSLGSAVPRQVWERRLLKLKEMGCNGIRMSHNPQASDVYELCDELGFVVMDEAFDEWEFAKRKWIDGWNVGKPEFQGSYSFFEEWGERDLTDMILRNRNHASIIMWSIGNEVDYPNDPYTHPVLNGAKINQPMFGGYLPDHPNAERLGNIAKRLAGVVRSLDTSRPVTAALAGVVMSNETEYPFVLDVAGYNYTENRYAIDHKKYPKRIIYGSETGRSYSSWKAVRDNDYIFGQFVWTGLDYLGEAQSWPSRGLNTGLIDLAGFMKPRGYFHKAMWSNQPTTYLGTYPQRKLNRSGAKREYVSADAPSLWNYRQGQTIRVVCYTNAPLSKLTLNGEQVGDVQTQNDSTGIIYWDVPYQSGKLEVTGMDKNNNPICNYAIQTSERPEAITAQADKTTLNANFDVAHVEIQIVDKNGVPVLLSDNELGCYVSGPGKLLALESGSNTDMTSQTDNVQRAYFGKLLAIVQSTGKPGTITVIFSALWLQNVEVKINVVE